MNQELAKEGIPLPFGNRFWSSNWPTQTAPFPGLLIYLVVTVSNHSSLSQSRSHFVFCETVIIIAPPQSRVSIHLGSLWVPNSNRLPICRSCQLSSLPPSDAPSIDFLKTGIFLSTLGKAQCATPIQRQALIISSCSRCQSITNLVVQCGSLWRSSS